MSTHDLQNENAQSEHEGLSSEGGVTASPPAFSFDVSPVQLQADDNASQII